MSNNNGQDVQMQKPSGVDDVSCRLLRHLLTFIRVHAVDRERQSLRIDAEAGQFVVVFHVREAVHVITITCMRRT